MRNATFGALLTGGLLLGAGSSADAQVFYSSLGYAQFGYGYYTPGYVTPGYATLPPEK